MRRLLITAILCAAALPAADFSGTWLGEIVPTFNGQYLRIAQQVAIQMVQTGNTLTGKLYGDYENAPILEGKVNGEAVDFVVVAQEQQGNQVSQSRLHFTGTLQKDGSIEITRVRENATNAGNSGAYKTKSANGKQTFSLKRLP